MTDRAQAVKSEYMKQTTLFNVTLIQNKATLLNFSNHYDLQKASPAKLFPAMLYSGQCSTSPLHEDHTSASHSCPKTGTTLSLPVRLQLKNIAENSISCFKRTFVLNLWIPISSSSSCYRQFFPSKIIKV